MPALLIRKSRGLAQTADEREEIVDRVGAAHVAGLRQHGNAELLQFARALAKARSSRPVMTDGSLHAPARGRWLDRCRDWRR